MLHLLYRGLTTLAKPALRVYLDRRLARGKEDRARHGERWGEPGRERPPGALIWLHGASVGEANSALILIERLLALSPHTSILLTTGTVTSAKLMENRLPERAFHQYVPVDVPDAVERFLDHWRPDAVLWMESELWPNLLAGVRRRHIPAALVNARLSERSLRGWRRVPGLSRLATRMLSTFQVILAQSDGDAARLRALGAPSPRCVGNLKFSAAPPPADPERLAALAEAIGDRPCWLFASTHAGEETLAAEAHAVIARDLPRLLTLIVPRHPHRGPAIAEELTAKGLTVSRRADGANPAPGDDVHVADTMGELGLFYRLAPVVCMGGSFVPHGGQNPVEPAQLGRAVIYGPHMFNFAAITRSLETAGGARALSGGGVLASTVLALLTDTAQRARLVDGAARVTEDNARIIDRVFRLLRPMLEDSHALPRPL